MATDVITPLPKTLITMEYKVVAGNTTASDPGNGSMKFNTSTQSNATQLYFDQLSVGNVDQSASFAAMAAGNVINFQQKDNMNVVGSFIIGSAPVNNTGWFTIAVNPGDFTGFPIAGGKSAIITCDTGTAAFGGHTYEYNIEHFNVGGLDADYLDVLNALGAQGWEMIFFTNIKTDDGQVRVWFKRQTA
jgi:hypothetical protein